MSLDKEEGTHYDAETQENSAEKVGEKIGETIKHSIFGEQIGPGLVRISKGAANARSNDGSNAPNKRHDGVGAGCISLAHLIYPTKRDYQLTLMLRSLHQLSDHGLNNSNVAVEETADSSTDQGNPDVGGESNHNHAEHGTGTSNHQHRLAANAVRQTTPVHAHYRLA